MTMSFVDILQRPGARQASRRSGIHRRDQAGVKADGCRVTHCGASSAGSIIRIGLTAEEARPVASKSSQKFIARNRAPRVQIEYDVELYGAEKKVQLPVRHGRAGRPVGQAGRAAAAGGRPQVPRDRRRQLRRRA
ncbi:MAG: type VI secretion system contractile sheath small subunit [Desulfobacterales bacterium]|nr:type VI secretion system contractile sheath small subunit [Desulfobacterales bacterium]